MTTTTNEAAVLRLARARRIAADGTARRIRQGARLSTADVAAVVGVASVTVTRWELGQRRPSGDAARKWLALLDRIEHESDDAA